MRRLLWALVALLLLATGGTALVVALGDTRAEGRGVTWIIRFVALVIAPLAAVGPCVHKAFQRRRGK